MTDRARLFRYLNAPPTLALMTARTLALLFLAPLAACSAPSDEPDRQRPVASRPAPAPEARSTGASGDVVREAQLTAEQGDELRFLGEPVLLPRLGSDWRVRSIDTETEYGTTYRVIWRREDGACVLLNGSNDGLGGPEYPIVSAEVAVPGLPGQPRYKVYKAAGDPASTSAETWGAGTVVSDYVTVGGTMSYWLNSYADRDGCRPLALEEGAQILASLRAVEPLARTAGAIAAMDEGQDPHWTDPELGTFLFDDRVTGDAMEGDPVEAVRAWMRSPELDDPEIQVLSSSADEIRILATRTNVPDDSVRDQRNLFVFRSHRGPMNFFVSALQFRCWPNRGHQDWSHRACS